MSYIAEFYKLRKSGKNKGKYIFLRKMEVDHISELVPNSLLNIVNNKGKSHRYFIDRREHVYYDGSKEYFLQYFIGLYLVAYSL